MGIVYRSADAGDLPALAELRLEFHGEGHGAVPGAGREAFLARCTAFMDAGLRAGTWTYWIAVEEGAIAGHVFIQRVDMVPRPDDSPAAFGYVTNVYVRPASRNRGIGTALMARSIRWAQARGMELLLVWPSEESAEFYRRAGFLRPAGILERKLDRAAPGP